jgi:hypothetical protein
MNWTNLSTKKICLPYDTTDRRSGVAYHVLHLYKSYIRTSLFSVIWQTQMDWGESGHSLFQGITHAFTWSDWGKQQKSCQDSLSHNQESGFNQEPHKYKEELLTLEPTCLPPC